MVDIVKRRHDLDTWRFKTHFNIESRRCARVPETKQNGTRRGYDDPRAATGELRMRRPVESASNTDTVGSVLTHLSLERCVERIKRNSPAVLFDDRFERRHVAVGRRDRGLEDGGATDESGWLNDLDVRPRGIPCDVECSAKTDRGGSGEPHKYTGHRSMI